jgi:hypothetical protein
MPHEKPSLTIRPGKVKSNGLKQPPTIPRPPKPPSQNIDNINDKLLPIGVIPKVIWITKRVDDLNSAIERYLNEGLLVPEEWCNERNEHLEWLMNKSK